MTDSVRHHVSANKMVISVDLNKNIYMLVQFPRCCLVTRILLQDLQLIGGANHSHSDA
jgi:hypothetical protein